MVRANHRVRAEQPAEEEDLGQQEDPRAQLPGRELLRRRAEMVRQVLGVVAGPWAIGLRLVGLGHRDL